MKLRVFPKTHNKINQKQLQMRMIKKYLKKDIYLQMKDEKLLIILEYIKKKTCKTMHQISQLNL